MPDSVLLWFRQDLRLHDNPLLIEAERRGWAVLPFFIWSPEEEGTWAPGAAGRWWLNESLQNLERDLREKYGLKLIFRRGPALETLQALAEETRAVAVLWNRRYEPAIIERDKDLKSALQAKGLEVHSFNSALLWEPWEVLKSDGTPYQVYGAFMRACLTCEVPAQAQPAPAKLPAPSAWPKSLALEDFELKPKIPFDEVFAKVWRPGEKGAQAAFSRFTEAPLKAYPKQRDFPADAHGTSQLSPHLHFGEISVRQIWHDIAARRLWGEAKKSYLREIIFREFSYSLLYHFPHTVSQPMREEFSRFPWKTDPAAFKAWTRGLTGYPIVDAGMRQLWETGWMHNRVRMIVASFLVKDLLIPWIEGARWFWDTLVDADLANNTFNWQWIAGSGADAAPYFRIFNPTLQGEKFDPDGEYVRRWVPELSRLPNKLIHKPWQAGTVFLESAKIKMGQTYPMPLIEHDEARMRALLALTKLKKKGPEGKKKQ